MKADWEFPPPTNTQDSIGKAFWVIIEVEPLTSTNCEDTEWFEVRDW